MQAVGEGSFETSRLVAGMEGWELKSPPPMKFINQAHQQVTNRAARQGQIEAQRFEG